MKKIVGYSDKISVCPGETISFMVNCEEGDSYEASIVRIIHGDTHPDGPGFKNEAIATDVDGRYPGRPQRIYAGSYIIVPDSRILEALESFSVQAMIWPTTPKKGQQTILARWDETSRCGFVFGIDQNGALSLRIGDGAGAVQEVTSGKELIAREWYFAGASFDARSGEVRLWQQPQIAYAVVDTEVAATQQIGARLGRCEAPVTIGAHATGQDGGRLVTTATYNGKIDSPRLASAALDRLEMQQLLTNSVPDHLKAAVVA
jgi:N,N-dimethylformamidase